MSVIAADAHADLVESLDQRVREAVRREGVDPQRDAIVVRRLAEAVVRAHDERSLTGVVAPVSDVDVDGRRAGRPGVRLRPAPAVPRRPDRRGGLDQRPRRVFVARRGRHELTNLMLTGAQVQELVERMLKSSGRRIDISRPFVDAMLPEGHRLHVVLEGISRGWTGGQHPEVRAHRRPAPRAGRARHPDRRRPRRSSRRRSAPASTSSSPAPPRPARPPCSTASPRRSPAATGWSAPRRSSSCGSRIPTGSRCRPGRAGWRAPARSGCATW